ncbi:MAG: MAPEG family protein [Leptolyngbyaceae cyanobacterium CSU_1_3]|nr:MAPEG family protein [Leptolyngbyaceae cyanobacterium CSU_1_3]
MSLFGLPVQTILLGSIGVAAFLVYLPFSVVGLARVQAGYNKEMMAAPRAALEKLPPFGQRATWAHENSWESFILFSVAALMAYVTNQTSEMAAWLAIAYLVVRLLYSAAYIFNIPALRSLMFASGSYCIGSLIVMSVMSTLK